LDELSILSHRPCVTPEIRTLPREGRLPLCFKNLI
jgi:hypothetical protein